jgi:hypothetical protein
LFIFNTLLENYEKKNITWNELDSNYNNTFQKNQNLKTTFIDNIDAAEPSVYRTVTAHYHLSDQKYA